MTKVKTSGLIGAALDWAVAQCEGYDYEIKDGRVCTGNTVFQANSADDHYGCEFDELYEPSTNWAQGGPIIDREKIGVAYEPSMLYDDSCRWKALSAMSDNEHSYGPAFLIAAMRCYVASKLGDEVDIPEELLA